MKVKLHIDFWVVASSLVLWKGGIVDGWNLLKILGDWWS